MSAGHIRVNVAAQARQDAVIERQLQRGHPVLHLHLDENGDRDVDAHVGGNLPGFLGPPDAVDQLQVRTENGLAQCIHRVDVARHKCRVADVVVDDHRLERPR